MNTKSALQNILKSILERDNKVYHSMDPWIHQVRQTVKQGGGEGTNNRQITKINQFIPVITINNNGPNSLIKRTERQNGSVQDLTRHCVQGIYSIQKQVCRAGDIAQWNRYLFGKHKVLSSLPGTTKRRGRRRGRGSCSSGRALSGILLVRSP